MPPLTTQLRNRKKQMTHNFKISKVLLLADFVTHTFQLKEELVFFYHHPTLKKAFKIVVPKGFNTDLSTEPLRFRVLNKRDKAAMVHDFLYSTPSSRTLNYISVKNEVPPLKVDRKTADLIWLQAMEVLEVNILQRYKCYWAVRIFAKKRWTRG